MRGYVSEPCYSIIITPIFIFLIPIHSIIIVILIIISIFLPLVSLKLGPISESVSLWEGGLKTKGDNTAAILILVMAILIALFSFLSNKKHLASIGTILVSPLLLLVAFIWYRDASELDAVGIGLYLLILGGLGAVVSAVMGFMKK